jgi:hypothetical protein
MATVTYDTFYPDVLPYVPGVPEFVALNAVRNACIEFCEKTNYWQVDYDNIQNQGLDSVASQSIYPITLPTDQELSLLMQVWYNGVLLTPKDPDTLTRLFRWCDWRQFQGQPEFYLRTQEPNLQLIPTPTISMPGEGWITFRASIKPTRASTTINSEIQEHFTEAIGLGARARLHMTLNQPYSDAKTATDCARLFKQKIGQTRIRVNQGLSRALTVPEFPRYI